MNNFFKEENELFNFRIGEIDIVKTLKEAAEKYLPHDELSEHVIPITFVPQALFKIHPVTRCATSMEGHKEAVLTVRFSPCGNHLVTGSGDTTIRVWDIHTCTPKTTLTGHANWVLSIEWAPNSKRFASGVFVGRFTVWGFEQKGHQLLFTSNKFLSYVEFLTGPNIKLTFC